MAYDVIVAGASFAGLTLASRIKGKTLLIDRKSVGSLPTSACATFYDVLEKMGCESSLYKVFHKVNWQTGYSSYAFDAVEPFCTFDYKEFCHSLLKKFAGEFLKANIEGYRDGSVITDKGTFSGRVVVDCTGWRATLGSSVKRDLVDEKNLFFGLEAVVPYEDDKLTFIMDSKIMEHGYAWIFPIDRGSRVGLGSYANSGLNFVEKLKNFVASFELEIQEMHGGFLPFRLRQAVLDKIFLVGDSGGQVFPLTAEGIRQGIYFAQACAEIIQKVVDGGISLEDGLNAYRKFVEKHRWVFARFLFTQNWILHAENRRLDFASKFACRRLPMNLVQKQYFNAMRIKPQWTKGGRD